MISASIQRGVPAKAWDRAVIQRARCDAACVEERVDMVVRRPVDAVETLGIARLKLIGFPKSLVWMPLRQR